MKTIETTEGIRQEVARLRSEGKRVGFVPTMGALHEGHLRLVDASRDNADATVVSIFINPTQFGPNEDFDRYPRNYERDATLLAERGADAVFLPDTNTIYPKGFSTYVEEEKLSQGMCGISRPGHFRGVCTVVTILFNIVQPDVAFFGQKDAQQAAIIRKITHDLQMPVEIVTVPTVREDDGLAMSSRNAYLGTGQRRDAAQIPAALQAGQRLVEEGVRSTDRILAEVRHVLARSRRLRVIYVEVIDRDTLEPLKEIIPGRTLIATAVWLDETRLIDNILV